MIKCKVCLLKNKNKKMMAVINYFQVALLPNLLSFHLPK